MPEIKIIRSNIREDKPKIRILMLSVGAIAGTFRVMMDILENIDLNSYQLSFTYQPAMERWDKETIDTLKGYHVEVMPLKGNKPLGIEVFGDVFQILRERSFDIIHCWDSLVIFARLIGKMFGCKIVQSIGNPPEQPSVRLSKTFFTNFLTSFLTDGVIFCSHQVMRSNMAHSFFYWKGSKITVIHNCVDMKRIRNFDKVMISNKYSLAPGQIVLTNIGYFNEQKGQTYLLQSLKRIVKARDNVRLVIVGWGPLENKLRGVTHGLGLEKHVIFTGKLSHNEVFEVLSFTDIFVLSSLWEGFGIVLAEAMASSVPVVTTDTDGSREVMVNGETGLIVPTKDPGVFAEAVLKLIGNPELRQKMGQNGKRRVNAMFSPRKFIKGHESFYRQILSY